MTNHLLTSVRRALIGGAGVPTFGLDLGLSTFTAAMAKRAGLKAFAAAPIVQGDANNASALTDDVLSLGRGSQVSGSFYDNFDGVQGTVNFWWTPEFAYDAYSGAGDHYLWYVSSDYYFAYEYDNDQYVLMVGGQSMAVGSNIAAGATYHLVTSWDCNNDLDGTNYARVSINDAHTFGITDQPTAAAPGATIYIGTNGTTNAASGIIEGFCISRLVWYDGTRGINAGDGDVINLAYAAGAGKDSALLTGSWDTTLFIPTNSTEEELSTGTGEAWSQPHSSSEAILTDTFCQTTWASTTWGTEGTPSVGPADTATAEQIFNWGYKWTCDAANEGVSCQIVAGDAGENYVLRVIAHCTSANDIRVRIWDETNGAQIGADFDFGASSSRTAPGVAIFCFELPTNARNGVAADCIAFSVKVMGVANTQVVYLHQAELQINLIDNPSLETWSGADPDIPDGWANTNLDAGDMENSAGGGAVIHSGVDAAQFNVGASAEGIRDANSFTNTQDDYYALGLWAYGDAGSDVILRTFATRIFNQSTGAAMVETNTPPAAWTHYPLVGRNSTTSNDALYVQAGAGASGVRYVDDVYVFELDAVSLTITPANEANSAEGSGLRVDGLDTLTQLQSKMGPKWAIKWRWTQRHAAADIAAFGEATPYIVDAYEDANNYVRAYWDAANSITIALNNAGGGEVTDTWNATGLIAAGTSYLGKLESNGIQLTFSVDGAVVATVASVAPDIDALDLNWGADDAGANQLDAVFASP